MLSPFIGSAQRRPTVRHQSPTRVSLKSGHELAREAEESRYNLSYVLQYAQLTQLHTVVPPAVLAAACLRRKLQPQPSSRRSRRAGATEETTSTERAPAEAHAGRRHPRDYEDGEEGEHHPRSRSRGVYARRPSVKWPHATFNSLTQRCVRELRPATWPSIKAAQRTASARAAAQSDDSIIRPTAPKQHLSEPAARQRRAPASAQVCPCHAPYEGACGSQRAQPGCAASASGRVEAPSASACGAGASPPRPAAA